MQKVSTVTVIVRQTVLVVTAFFGACQLEELIQRTNTFMRR